MDKNSFYVLVEQLSQLDIEDKKMLNKVPGVLSFRQAKSRRAFQFRSLPPLNCARYPFFFSYILTPRAPTQGK
jgi:hypothetical protein